MAVVIIDNYDSFVHNLARYIREAGEDVIIIRNDSISASDVLASHPKGVVISPGPKSPTDAGICLGLLALLSEKAIPVLGVCLGHQCIVEYFGGTTQHAQNPLHGVARKVRHTGEGILAGLPSPFLAGRYHSLISVVGDKSPLLPVAWGEEGELLGVRHANLPWYGVQFHPESLLTPSGREIIENFLCLCEENE